MPRTTRRKAPRSRPNGRWRGFFVVSGRMVGPTSPFAGSRSRGLGGLAKKAGPVGHVWGSAEIKAAKIKAFKGRATKLKLVIKSTPAGRAVP